MIAAWLLVICMLTAAGTWAVRGYARRRLLDIPGDRSSHDTPRPRGGGAAIVVVVTCAYVAAAIAGIAPVAWWPAVAVSLAVAGLGFVDDHIGLPAMLRLAGHVAAGLVTVAVLDVPMASVAAGAMVFAIVWMINLTNFMDGIDGIASIQTVAVCAGGALVTWLGGGDPVVVGASLVVAASVSGFLVLNWPPASIFMGDVGSVYLGFVIAVLALWAALTHPTLLAAWLLLNGTFIVDATVTLGRRMLLRESLFTAHRSHAYQLLTPAEKDHRRVSLWCGAIDVAWLLPIAVAVVQGWVGVMAGLTLAWTPLIAGALWVQARRYTRTA